jgi:hypothetical protein
MAARWHLLSKEKSPHDATVGSDSAFRRDGRRYRLRVLAYLFWHAPLSALNAAQYERRLIHFHTQLAQAGYTSAAFRLDQLPFAERPGYEDWYLVEDWAALGELNEAAVSDVRAAPHDAVARLARDGWGGVYRLVRGTSRAPRRGRWTSKPRNVSYEAFLDVRKPETVWQRQLVLGPAPEFFLCGEPSDARLRVWPPRLSTG